VLCFTAEVSSSQLIRCCYMYYISSTSLMHRAFVAEESATFCWCVCTTNSLNGSGIGTVMHAVHHLHGLHSPALEWLLLQESAVTV
jgi:hypothetical protein